VIDKIGKHEDAYDWHHTPATSICDVLQHG
jgi:hypothetical protein